MSDSTKNVIVVVFPVFHVTTSVPARFIASFLTVLR